MSDTPAPLLQLIRTRVHHPATIRELMRRLSISRQDRHEFRRQVAQLVDQGDLIRIRGNRFSVPGETGLQVGCLHVNPRGFGFVSPEPSTRAENEDIYVAGDDIGDAMHGDRVVVRAAAGQGRREGRIVQVLERAQAEVVGRYRVEESGVGFVTPLDPRLSREIQIPTGMTKGAQSGHMVAVQIDRWPTARKGPVGHVAEVFGNVSDPGVDTKLIIRQYALREEHDAGAVAEAEGLGTALASGDHTGRTDFRALSTVTIDGESARDFDDAITVEVLPNGHYSLGVHIADVAHYVKEGGALDASARERGTSVYFPERALHMLPSALATGLCSLKPGVERLVQSCVMEVDRRGRVARFEFHDGIIHSDARMTYTAVEGILQKRDPELRCKYAELVPMLELLETVYRRLRIRRTRRGAIDFELTSTQLVLDEVGAVENIVAVERNVAHRIIEECMLAANEVVAGYLRDHEDLGLFRIHEQPDPEKVSEFDDFASALGHGLGVPPDRVRPQHFQRVLKRVHGQPAERAVALLMLRTMQKARYDSENHGHFGLASEAYTHFTSPIRRYPDLVVHRLLREVRYGKLSRRRRDELEEVLPEIARQSSAMERRAEEAEREIVHWKKVRFMADKVGEEFSGCVTGVTGSGLFVELEDYFVEGLAHISGMVDDYYRFRDTDHTLLGERSGKAYRLGDTVAVRVLAVHVDRRQIDLGLAEILETVRQSPRSQARHARRPAMRRRRVGGRGRGRRARH